MSGKIQALLDMLRGGAAANGAGVIDLRKQYNDYAIKQQEQGLQALPFDDFAKQQSAQSTNPYKR